MKLASVLFCCAWVFVAHAAKGPVFVPLLTLKGQMYTNVEVTSATTNRLFIRHASGLATLRVEELGNEAREQLGLPALPPPKTSSFHAGTNAAVVHIGSANFTVEKDSLRVMNGENATQDRVVQFVVDSLGRIEEYTRSWVFWAGLATLAAVIYFIYCGSLWMICERSGFGTSMLVLLPVVRWIPMLKAAGMPVGLIFFGVFGPLGVIMPPWLPNTAAVKMTYFTVIAVLQVAWFVTVAVWSFRICKVMERSAGLGFLMLFPLTHPFAVVALALGRKPAPKTPVKPLVANTGSAGTLKLVSIK